MIGIASAAAATVLQLGLWPWVGPSRFILYYPVMVLTSLAGGMVAGIAYSLTSALLALYVFFPPRFSFELEEPHAWAPLGVYGISCTGIILITELLRRRERALHDDRIHVLNAKLATVIDQLPAAVIIAAAPGGEVLHLNRKFFELWGAAEGMKNVLDGSRARRGLRDGKEIPNSDWPLNRALTRGESVRNEEIELVRPDGTTRTVLSSAEPVRGRNGEIIAAVVMASDITERKAMEHELQRSLLIRDEFLSVASHELRTPLTSLLLQSQMRQRQIARDGGEAFFPVAKLARIFESDTRQYQRLSRLVEDMLEMSRANAGSLKITPERFDLAELVMEIVERFRPEFEATNVPIEVNVPERSVGEWDRHRIEQVLTNLLSNALKYGDGTLVEVSVRREGGRFELRVSNGGRSIAEEDRERIFNRYERGESWRHTSGLGLGLYISRNILRLHGGDIRVESGTGAVTTFVASLPAMPVRTPG